METLILDVPVFSGKIISPIWIKVVRDFQSKSKTENDFIQIQHLSFKENEVSGQDAS